MKIDPKYFNIFAVIVAATGIAAILYFTISYAHTQRQGFIENVGDGRAIHERWFYTFERADSVRAADWPDHFVIIDFWSTWSGPSHRSHELLWETLEPYAANVRVIAASVKDNKELTAQYRADHRYPFYYVDGTEAFQDLLAPGVPSQIVFAPGGSLADIRIGFRRDENYDELKSIIQQFLQEKDSE